MGKLKRVTKLQAKALKRLGYNRDATAYYLENKARLINKMLFETHVSEDWNHNKNGSQYRKEADPLYPYISAPTLDEVIEWLREEYDLIIIIEIDYKYDYIQRIIYNYYLYFPNGFTDREDKNEYSKIEYAKREAISKAIKYLLNDKFSLYSRI